VVVVQDGDARATIDGDAIARAVDNILRNAIEASKQGDRVEAHVSGDREVVQIEVVDHGDGVAPKRAAELFEPFFTTKPEGTGLGLALARAVAESHGGTLTYMRQGHATKFTLALSINGAASAPKGLS
jgi:signal transduction histidine kinase